MKVIIAGSRSITDYQLVKQIFHMSNMQATEIVSGCALGVDTDAVELAEELGLKCTKMPAHWKNGKGAGFVRNIQMADYADALIAIWDGKSKGTAHMIEQMRKRKKSVFVFNTIDSKGTHLHVVEPREIAKTNTYDTTKGTDTKDD